jgi:hypothetical protein
LGAVGSTTGLATGLLQAYAANPNASFAEYAISGGFSWLGGAFMPGSGIGGLTGTLGGAYGGQYLPGGSSTWAQFGGLAGEVSGGGVQGMLRTGVRSALVNMAWEGGGATIGAGLGGLYYGTPEGALFGANIGSFSGGIAQGVTGLYRGFAARWSTRYQTLVARMRHNARLKVQVSPHDLGIHAISENPTLLRLWEDSIRELLDSPDAVAVPGYFRTIEAGGIPTGREARAAYKSVRAKFMQHVCAAQAAGESFEGYRFEKFHHWNWYMRDYPMEALDPRQIFPVSPATHDFIHQLTSVGPSTTYDPIHMLHVRYVDPGFWPIAPR